MSKHKQGIIVLVVSLIAFAILPLNSFAIDMSDYDVPAGHIYTQAAGSKIQGYRISDDDGIPFWSEYQRLGAEKVLGYPISHRFVLDGTTVQATQRAILQWKSSERQVALVNIVDFMSTKGLDVWMERNRGVPRPAPQPAANQTWEQTMKARRTLLDTAPVIAAYYDGNPDSLKLYGLPSSAAVDRGDYIVMRFQRGVLAQWKSERPWALIGDVTASNVGDWAKENGLFPAKALEPENLSGVPATPTAVPTLSTPRATATPTPTVTAAPSIVRPPRDLGTKVTGLATWYGQPFHGRRTASGEVFDMYNPTTTACNIFPIGTWLKVTRLGTNNSVVVRVNDTGGFTMPYVVDLSYAAFQKLGGDQSQQVEVEVVVGP